MNFPLGEPVNRPPAAPKLRPIEGRPNWWIDSKGVEQYIEPPRPPTPWHPMPIQSDAHVEEIILCYMRLLTGDADFDINTSGPL